MAVRSIPKNYRNVTGMVAHNKAVDKAMFESTLERDFITLLEFSSEVTYYDVQPITIEWADSLGKRRIYTPDVLVKYEGEKPVLFEVKYRSDIKKDWTNLKPKFIAAIKFAKQHDWKFKLITEIEIRTPLLSNVRFLLPFIRRGIQNEGDINLIDQVLGKNKLSTPQELLSHLANNEWDRAALLPTLWYMVGTKQICCDLKSTPLTMNSPISWKS